MMKSICCAVPAVIAAAAVLASPVRGGEVLDFMITLDGWQEVPAVMTEANGTGTATLDTGTLLFSWEITFEGLRSPQTAAHFHGPAPVCEGAGVVVPLPTGSPISGSETLTAEQAQQVMDGLWYVNIHTEGNTAGEIRGQVMPTPLDDPLPDPIPAGEYAIVLEPLSMGLTSPVWATSAPGDPGRLYVVDQAGIVWDVDVETGKRAVFLDVSKRLVDLNPDFDERGLLGLAFAPDFDISGLLYTYTSEPATEEPDFSTMPRGVAPNHQSVVTQWTVMTPGEPGSPVDPVSATEVLRIDEPQFNHNGGAMSFGPDGFLYIALGDGGGADDHDGEISGGVHIVGHGCIGNGQDIETPLGALLRIDPDPAGGYMVPLTNPFVGRDGLDLIWAYGLRNPFRFSFDRLTGELWLGDVGQGDIEEINIISEGENYGWNQREGSFVFVRNGENNGYITDRPLPVPVHELPVAEYDHDEGTAVIGGFVYRGSAIAALNGRYIFGDFSAPGDGNGRLFYLDEALVIHELQFVGGGGLGAVLLGFGEDAAGELYVLTSESAGPSGTSGVVWRIAARAGDADLDGIVGHADLDIVIDNYEACPPAPDPCPGDVDGNGVVNVDDLVAVLVNWDLGLPERLIRAIAESIDHTISEAAH